MLILCAAVQEEDHAALYACLRRIFERSTEFGGGLFALAASVMTDQIHHEPLSFNALEEAGLPEAFLNAIKVLSQNSFSSNSVVLRLCCIHSQGVLSVFIGAHLNRLPRPYN